MTTKQKGSIVRYKQLLIQAGRMQAKTRDRIKLLVEVFEDGQFRADLGGADDVQAAKVLDGYVKDLAITFLESHAVLMRFPDAEDWKSGDLRGMYQTVRDESRALRDEDENGRKSPRRITIIEHEKIVAENSELEGRNKYLQSEVNHLRTENASLREQIATLKGRLTELERIAKLEPAAA